MTWIEFRNRWIGAVGIRVAGVVALAVGVLVASALPVIGQDEAPPLPEDKIVVEIDAPDEDVFRIGIPDLIGNATELAANGGAILQNDFRLMPGFRVIGPSAVRHDATSRGLGVDLGAWAVLGANGVIKGQVFGTDAGMSVELRFYQSSGGEVPVLPRESDLGAKRAVSSGDDAEHLIDEVVHPLSQLA